MYLTFGDLLFYPEKSYTKGGTRLTFHFVCRHCETIYTFKARRNRYIHLLCVCGRPLSAAFDRVPWTYKRIYTNLSALQRKEKKFSCT